MFCTSGEVASCGERHASNHEGDSEEHSSNGRVGCFDECSSMRYSLPFFTVPCAYHLWQRRLTGYEGPLNLVATGRALKKEGYISRKCL